MTSSVLSSFLSSLLFWNDASSSSSQTTNNNNTQLMMMGSAAEESHSMPVLAVPGLMTLLDVALYRAVEGQLTGMICTAHALLAAWLDVKRQAALVLRACKYELSDRGVVMSSSSSGSSGSGISSSTSSRLALMEGFARACFDAACDAIERITTDRLAQSANLSDPFEGSGGAGMSSSSSSAHHSSSAGGGAGISAGVNTGGGGGGGGPSGGGNSSSSNGPGLLAALQDSSLDTGRRDATLQRPRDCWETSRLLCPDHCWADDVSQYCQRLIRQLNKHAFVVTESTSHNNNNNSSLLESSPVLLGDSTTRQSQNFGGGAPPPSASGYTERHAALLLQLLQTDLPCRLVQFRSAMEAESVLTKRLYLVKCEYRAPFRAFCEAHQSVQRAPSLQLVEEYHQSLSSSSSKMMEETRVACKARLQKLLETPELVETLALERQIELFEVEMAKALFPFCELARYLDYKKASLKPLAVPSGIFFKDDGDDDGNDDDMETAAAASGDLMVELQETLYRLKNCLLQQHTTSGGSRKLSSAAYASHDNHHASGGIRPLLLDLQGVPRDEDDQPNTSSGNAMSNPKYREMLFCQRLDRLIRHLRILAKLSEKRNFFRTTFTGSDHKKAADSSSSSTVVDIPSSIIRGCLHLDHELFSCHGQDWYTMTMRQNELANNREVDLEALAEEIRTAEVQKSLAVANAQSLGAVLQRLQVIHTDREKRFEVLKETIEEVCWREMNLHVSLSAPDTKKVLVLPENTSAIGVFGAPLEMAGESLPIG